MIAMPTMIVVERWCSAKSRSRARGDGDEADAGRLDVIAVMPGLPSCWPRMPVGLKISTNVRIMNTRNSDQRE